MYITKTAGDLADEFVKAYATVKPFEEVFRKRIEAVIRTIKDFHDETRWYSDDAKFSWVEHIMYPTVEVGNVTSTGIYFAYNSSAGYEDDAFLTFSDMDNISTVLTSEYAIYVAKRDGTASQWKASEKARLKAELAALDE